MHRDVKRALILWPAAASATITAAAWVAQINVDLTESIQRTAAYLPSLGIEDVAVNGNSDSAVPMAHRIATHRDPSPVLRAEVKARAEHGSRAMQLPERVAAVYGTVNEVIAAPIRDPQREMAGYVEPESGARQSALPDSAPPVDLALNPDFSPPTFVPTPASVSTPGPTSGRISRSEPRFPMVIGVEPTVIGVEPTVTGVEPTVTGVEGWEWSPPVLPEPESVLPKSTRILAKPAPTQPKEFDSVDVDNAELDRELAEAFPAISEIEFAGPDEPASLGDISLPPTAADDISRGASPIDSATQEPVIRPERKQPQVAPPSREPALAGWPVTNRLIDQLKSLMSNDSDEAVQWAARVSQTLDQLRALPRLGDPGAGELIDTLDALASNGSRQAELVPDRTSRVEWLLASHALTRRVAVWKPIWQLGQSNWMVTDDTIDSVLPSNDRAAVTITAAIADVREDIELTGDGQGWTEFLLLDEIERATKHSTSRDRTVLAQRVLSRLEWHDLDEEQQRWLQRDAASHLAEVIRPWARGAVDYANLLRQLERQEADALDLAAIDIANSVQSLRFADSLPVVQVGDAINTYYRNANVRLALSQAMLQRMMPTIEPQSVPVRTTMLGSRVQGTSRIESDLRVQLYPSPDRWLLNLKAVGNIRTQSTGFNSGVSVRTLGNAEFNATTPMEITRDDIHLDQPQVDVRGGTRLRSVRSDYDGWPLVGSLVRGIAKNRFESDRNRATRLVNRRIESEVEREFEQRLNQRIEDSTSQLGEMVLGPLSRLQLDPKVMDMQTTESRLLARYRLAGDWQLGAFTPRPRAPRSSLMSVQVHQSALNNTLEQLVPRDRPMSIEELINQSAATFAQKRMEIPDDIPADVTVQFAKTRPITVEIEDGQLWVTLRVIRLRRADRLDLTQFIVRANYKPELDGMNARLVRDGHLRISGPGMSMRERLPIRAIFNKVLSPNRHFQLTLPNVADHPAMEGLAVSQLELRDGWIAMAISEEDAPRVALLK